MSHTLYSLSRLGLYTCTLYMYLTEHLQG